MFKDYPIVSPSLDGVLTHETLLYDGIRKPIEILRAFDCPAADRNTSATPYQHKMLEQYFYDLYGIFMKKLSAFVLDPVLSDAEAVKIQAMLQEMVKVKRIFARGH